MLRASASTAFYWGAVADHNMANFGSETCCDGLVAGKDLWRFTAPVGSFPPNGLGLHDMLGNVAEWVEDCYEPNYLGASEDGSACSECATEDKSVRGGSWKDRGVRLRLNFRDYSPPGRRDKRVGFRLVSDP